MELSEFCSAHMARPWSPGDVDCLLALADWCIAKGYPDPASHLRGTYQDEDGFRAIIEAVGGVVPLVGSCAERIGLERATVQGIGFIGVVGSRTNIQRQWGGIWDDGQKGWRVRMLDSYPAVKAQALAIWKI